MDNRPVSPQQDLYSSLYLSSWSAIATSPDLSQLIVTCPPEAVDEQKTAKSHLFNLGAIIASLSFIGLSLWLQTAHVSRASQGIQPAVYRDLLTLMHY